jgi:serine/threonine protein kinase
LSGFAFALQVAHSRFARTVSLKRAGVTPVGSVHLSSRDRESGKESGRESGRESGSPRSMPQSVLATPQSPLSATSTMAVLYSGERTRVVLSDGFAVKSLQFRTALACSVTRDVVQALIAVRHANVQQVVRIAEDAAAPTSLTLVCEFCAGGALDVRLQQPFAAAPVTPALQRGWAHGIACGMQALHRANILHLDLAARNVLLTGDGVTPKLCDFKMSMRTNVHDAPVEFRDQFSPLKWMSPEGLQSRRVTRKHDVWAFGVTLLEIMHREHDEPYADCDALEVAAGVAQMRLRPKFSPAAVASTPDLVALSKWCMAWFPVQRPAFDAIVQTFSPHDPSEAPATMPKRQTLPTVAVPAPSLTLRTPSGSLSSSGNSSIAAVRTPSAGSGLLLSPAPAAPPVTGALSPSAASTPRRSGLYQCGACAQRFNTGALLEEHLSQCTAATSRVDDGGGSRSPRRLELPPSSPSLDVLSRWRIDWSDLRSPPPNVIGEGHHSLVLGATWRGARVALKLHKRKASPPHTTMSSLHPSGQIEFDSEQLEAERLNRIAAASPDITTLLDTHADAIVAEAKLMANLSPHPNVVQLLGFCFSPFLIVTEFMPGGSLRALLDMGGIRMDERMRLDILADIAAGMRHLNLEGIVHKDLAARNVLLGGASPTLRAKVCDFGLSRVLSSDSVYSSTSEPGPTKWLPRESLLEWKFSSASDVWMFAITAIEVLTRQLPYPDLPHQQFVALLVSRQLDPYERVPVDITHPLLQRCLRQCLSPLPTERPTFEAICATLNQCRSGSNASPAAARRPTRSEMNVYN